MRIPFAPRYAARAVLTSLVLAVQDKDTGKYNLALAQALDGIKAKSAWIAVRVSSVLPVVVLASVLTIRWRHRSARRPIFNSGWTSGSRARSCEPGYFDVIGRKLVIKKMGRGAEWVEVGHRTCVSIV